MFYIGIPKHKSEVEKPRYSAKRRLSIMARRAMMQQAHALRKHLRNDLPDYEEDEETISDVDMYGDL